MLPAQTPTGNLTAGGHVLDPQGRPVPGVRVNLSIGHDDLAQTRTDSQGLFRFSGLIPGTYQVRADSKDFVAVSAEFSVPGRDEIDLQFQQLISQRDSVVISARTNEPALDLRNSEVFNRTLFTRDDQVFQQLNAGINAGQHEGGGKSLEIRRFGFNLDHGGVNGGLKVLIDNVQQNQGTQGHGQGYLGSLKALSPELIQDVTVINGPFSPEYGDFSGLGVVHIRQRESLPDEYTVRLQGGNFNTGRGFLAWSPVSQKAESYVAYEGSYSDGPFQVPLEYRRDNLNVNYTRTLSDTRKAGLRFLFGRNNFYSSGQIPLDLVASGQLDRFGFIDPTEGGRVKLGTLSGYFSQSYSNGGSFKVDGFLGRSLFDLYSNFTYFLNDPVHGDAFQQHDSRLQEGANAQYIRPHRIGSTWASFTGGGNFHDNQINVGQYPRDGRMPTGVNLRANAHVTNAAGYAQENLSLLHGHLLVNGGLRYDVFRYGLTDRVNFDGSGVQTAGRWQGKGSAAYTPSHRIPVTFHANYGRGINSVDARGVVLRPDNPRIATTDFYQFGTSSNFGRASFTLDAFLIDHSNEQVYVPDDGSIEFQGPTRGYGYEAKLSLELTRHLSLNGGVTKIGNAFFKGGPERVYVVRAPKFVGNAALTLANWHGWSGSLRMRAVNRYRLDEDEAGVFGSGLTVVDLGLSRRINRRLDFNLSLDNLTNRHYYETQNYFESRVTPEAPIVARIHGTPGYPLTAVAGVTIRFGAK